MFYVLEAIPQILTQELDNRRDVIQQMETEHSRFVEDLLTSGEAA